MSSPSAPEQTPHDPPNAPHRAAAGPDGASRAPGTDGDAASASGAPPAGAGSGSHADHGGPQEGPGSGSAPPGLAPSGPDSALNAVAELTQALDARLPAVVEQAVNAGLAEFSQLMRARLTRDEQFAAMQKEVEAHRSDIALKAMRPLVLSIISAHDNLSKVVDRLRKGGEQVERGEVLRILGGVGEDLELALSQNGIDVFSRDNVEQPFDGKTQTTVGYVDTDDPGRKGKVAELTRAGFASDAIIVQKQRVRVYRERAPS